MEDIIKQKLEELRNSLHQVHNHLISIEVADLSDHSFIDKKLQSEVSNLFNSIGMLSLDIPIKISHLSGKYYKEKELRERLKERYFLVNENKKLSLHFLSNVWIGNGEYLSLQEAKSTLKQNLASQMRRWKKIRSRLYILAFDLETKTYKKIE